MSSSKSKPGALGNSKREPQRLPAPVRAELAFALNEARALLDTAHVIESTLGPLAWTTTPHQVRTAAAALRKLGPALFERLVNVCTRMERLALLTERHTPTKDE